MINDNKRSLLFIGRLNTNRGGISGVILKNRIFFESIRSLFSTYNHIDLDYIKQPLIFLKLCVLLLKKQDVIIIASGCSKTSCSFIKFIQSVSRIRNRHSSMCIIGLGDTCKHIQDGGQYSISIVNRCTSLLVEGKRMVEELKRLGINRVYYCPNFKPIPFLPVKKKRNDNDVYFLYFSRINPEKGVRVVFDAIQRLRDMHIFNFKVFFYGYISGDYYDEFLDNIEKYKDVASYLGVRDATSSATYEEIASYDVFLFPTFWRDEGFPGALIDAFIAGLPVIATDWNYNSELVNADNGVLIPPKDSQSLADRMFWMITHREFIENQRDTIQKKALCYDTSYVLNKEYLTQVGIL